MVMTHSHKSPALSEDQVMAYLDANPDFLLRHPDLVPVLAPPSRWPEAGAVVDMQVYMIARQREEMGRVRAAAEDLILTSRTNMSVQSRTHAAALALLHADDMGLLARTVNDDLPALLDVDVACLCFEDSPEPRPELIQPGIQRLTPGEVDRILGGDDHDCLLSETAREQVGLFGDGAGLATSTALVRLECGQDMPDGLLALGARRPDTFHPGQGTELIGFLARVAETCVKRFLIS